MKRYLGFICLLYSGIIIYAIKTDILKNFLATSMHIYVKFALILLLLMAPILLLNKNIKYKFKFSDLLLLVPIIFIILSGNGRLTESFSKGRISRIDKNNMPIMKIEKSTEEDVPVIEENNDDYDFTNPDFVILDENYYELSGYITFLIDIDKYKGKTIKVRGFVDSMSDYVTKEYFGIGKYVITCCAADSIYAGFIVKYDDFDIKEGEWYEIEGILEEAIDKTNTKILAIKIINLSKIDSKSEELYAYPCYTYKDGSCMEVTKYNLEPVRN